LSASSFVVSFPGPLTIPAGAMSFTFKINTSPVSINTVVNVTARTFNSQKSAGMTVTH
jgi:hypothetical protein